MDSFNVGNSKSELHSVRVDRKAPDVSITDVPTDLQTGAFEVSIEFTEDVTGFEANDISLTGTATATATRTGSGAKYTATITPTTQGSVIIKVPENVAKDVVFNANTASLPTRCK